jgi:hypothetical protein
MEEQAKVIVDALHATGVKRLIFISSMGIYAKCRANHPEASSTRIGIPPPSLRHPIWITPFCGPAGLLTTKRSITRSRKKVNRSRVTMYR